VYVRSVPEAMCKWLHSPLSALYAPQVPKRLGEECVPFYWWVDLPFVSDILKNGIQEFLRQLVLPIPALSPRNRPLNSMMGNFLVFISHPLND
jgi:hypothetical protein